VDQTERVVAVVRDALGDAAGEWGELLPRVWPHVDHVLGEIRSLPAQSDEREA
jgi:hypothetical protein